MLRKMTSLHASPQVPVVPDAGADAGVVTGAGAVGAVAMAGAAGVAATGAAGGAAGGAGAAGAAAKATVVLLIGLARGNGPEAIAVDGFAFGKAFIVVDAVVIATAGEELPLTTIGAFGE